MTRIEDLTVNLLILEGEQVLNEQWLQKLHTQVRDTGNAMSDPQIVSFSREVNFTQLLLYQAAVGQRTVQVIDGLTHSDLKRRVNPAQIQKILAQGGVSQDPDSLWLLDFWGKKDVAGILLIPVTRHRCPHLNSALKLKGRLQ